MTNMSSKHTPFILAAAKATAIATLLMATINHSEAQTQGATVTADWQSEESRQFDFWIGSWDVNLRMIQPDLTWEESIEAKVEIYPVLDGKGILELWDSPTVKGFSLRYYDPKEAKWMLYLDWPNGKASSFRSLAGTFRHGRGEFFAEHQGVLSRFTFCDVSPTSLRWDDAYSKDGGKTWSHSWIMEFSRTAAAVDWPAQAPNALTFDKSGTRCVGSEAEFDLVASVAGHWNGEVDLSDGNGTTKAAVTARAYRILDGCATIQLLEFKQGEESFRTFSMLTYNQAEKRFEELRLDNRVGTSASVLYGKLAGGTLGMRPAPTDGKSETESSPLTTSWTFPSSASDELRVEMRQTLDGIAVQQRFVLTRTEPSRPLF